MSTYLLAVSPGKASRIREVADLRGGIVGFSSFGGPDHRMLAYYLRRSGLSLADVQLTAVGAGSTKVAAVQHGKVDAAMIVGLDVARLMPHAPGLRILVDPRSREKSKELFGVEVFPGGTGLIATSRWLSQNLDKARRMARAMSRTLRWIREHSPEEVLSRVTIPIGTDDRPFFLEHMRVVIGGLYSRDGRFPPGGAEAVQHVLAASMEDVKTVNLAATWTNDFLEER